MDSAIFAARRERLLAQLEGAVALVASSSEKLRNGDTHYRHRADSDFYYLTGFCEPDAIALLTPNHPEHRFVLFVRPKEPAKEVWTGWRSGVEGALRDYGADAAFPLSEFAKELPSYLEGNRRLHYRLGSSPELDQQVISSMTELRAAKRRLTPSPTEVHDVTVLLHEMRLRKEPEELALMRKAADISVEAMTAAMRGTRPGRHEYEIEANLEATYRLRGGNGPAYPSIVASAENGTVLHYIENSRRMEDGEMLLIDAAAEYQFYASDLTRTYPVNGRFTSIQRDVYQIVLGAQKAAIAAALPGQRISDVHDAAIRKLSEGLIELGVLKGSVEEVLESQAHKPYSVHQTSHYLGLDTHDVGDYVRDGESRRLEPNMVLTIEPGLYFATVHDSLPPELKGIAVRIEDDLLITNGEAENLTRNMPKEIPELESLIGTD